MGGLAEVILEVSLDSQCSLQTDLLSQSPALQIVLQCGLPQPDVPFLVESHFATDIYL